MIELDQFIRRTLEKHPDIEQVLYTRSRTHRSLVLCLRRGDITHRVGFSHNIGYVGPVPLFEEWGKMVEATMQDAWPEYLKKIENADQAGF